MLRAALGKNEIKKSLQTGDLREAQQLARVERFRVQAEWDILRLKLAPAVPTTLSDSEVFFLVSKWFVKTEKADIESKDRWMSREDAEFDHSALAEEHNSDVAFRAVEMLLEEENIILDPRTDARRRLESRLREAMVEAAGRSLKRDFPAAAVPADPQFANLSAASILKPVAKNTITHVIDKYQNDATRTPMSPKTKLKREAQWHTIQQFFGPDTAIDQIDRDKVRGFMDLLKRLPSNSTKHFPNATIFEAVTLGSAKGLPVLAVVTANDYLRTLGGLFRFAMNEELLMKDPTASLLISTKNQVRAKDKRLPFSTDELRAIFSAPLYTGAIDDKAGYARPGPNVIRRGRFWIPLISLFTGMRLNEACQLTLNDFAFEDGTDVIHIGGDDDDETKRVKTQAGKRFVPLHPELRKIGLLAFVEERRRSSKPTSLLFLELPIGGTGYRSDPFSKFFKHFRNHVGIVDRKKVFHSFRHNYRDGLREADISIEKVRALGGWSTGRTEDDYGKGLRPSTLAKAIEQVGYPGLDLSHLHP